MLCVALLSTSLFAQKNKDNMTDKEMNKKLQNDLNTRYPAASKSIVVWDNNDYGFNGSYSVNNTSYMARYDKQGKYIETLTRKNWDDNVPVNVRNSYDNSPYKSYKIDSYWEVNDPMKKGYYIRTKDTKGKLQDVWMDDQGKVYDKPDYKKNEMKKKMEDEKNMD